MTLTVEHLVKGFGRVSVEWLAFAAADHHAASYTVGVVTGPFGVLRLTLTSKHGLHIQVPSFCCGAKSETGSSSRPNCDYCYTVLEPREALVFYSSSPWRDHAQLSRFLTTWLDEEAKGSPLQNELLGEDLADWLLSLEQVQGLNQYPAPAVEDVLNTAAWDAIKVFGGGVKEAAS